MRFVNVKHLFKQIVDVYLEHDCEVGKQCSFSDFYIEKFIDHGIESKFILKCLKCSYESCILCDLNDKTKMNINDRAFIAALAAGDRYSAIELILGNICSLINEKFYITNFILIIINYCVLYMYYWS